MLRTSSVIPNASGVDVSSRWGQASALSSMAEVPGGIREHSHCSGGRTAGKVTGALQEDQASAARNPWMGREGPWMGAGCWVGAMGSGLFLDGVRPLPVEVPGGIREHSHGARWGQASVLRLDVKSPARFASIDNVVDEGQAFGRAQFTSPRPSGLSLGTDRSKPGRVPTTGVAVGSLYAGCNAAIACRARSCNNSSPASSRSPLRIRVEM